MSAVYGRPTDLLVCGSRHAGLAKRVLLGSTSDYLARHSACPLLVTPVADQDRVATWRRLRKAASAA